jgi:RNA polymerase sigma-70 factor (ECF subfamily)
MTERSSRMHTEGSMPTTRMSEDEPILYSTVKSEYPALFGADDLNNPRHYSDDELVVAAQNGVSPALGLLLTRHRGILYGTVRRMTTTAEEAEDVVQDAMLRACASIGTFRREARFSTWLITIATNSLLSLRRRTSSTQWLYLDDAETPSHQRRSRVQREMQKLHRSHRSVLETRDIDQESIRDCASELGITTATFKNRLSRARSRLSRALERAGVDRPAKRGRREKRP